MDNTEEPKTSEKPIEKSLELPRGKSKNSDNKKSDSPAESSSIIQEKKKSKSAPFFKMFVLLIAVLALSIAAYTCFQMQKLITNHNQDKKNLSETLLRLEKQGANLDKAVNQTQEKLSATKEKLQDALSQAYYQKQDWLLLKARNYLELAQIQTNWSDDPKITIALLQGADSVLKNIKSQTALPIRQSIAKEMAELEALPQIDFSGLLSQLDALQTTVMQLPIADQKNSNKENSGREKYPSSSWKSQFQKSLRSLRSLIVVKHYEGDLQPMLSPLHQALLRESVRINLQQAQWAILHKHATIYQKSLQKAMEHIKATFDLQAKNTQSLIQQLERLQQQSLSVDKPSLSQSLELINQWIDSEKGKNQEALTSEGVATP